MTYLSKRTRDLQGEVVANDGTITLYKTIKPDGTIVYHISASEETSYPSKVLKEEGEDSVWCLYQDKNANSDNRVMQVVDIKRHFIVYSNNEHNTPIMAIFSDIEGDSGDKLSFVFGGENNPANKEEVGIVYANFDKTNGLSFLNSQNNYETIKTLLNDLSLIIKDINENDRTIISEDEVKTIDANGDIEAYFNHYGFHLVHNDGDFDIYIDRYGIHIEEDGNERAIVQTGNIILRDDNGDDRTSIEELYIYLYNNEGNDNIVIEHSNSGKIYIRNFNGNDGINLVTDENDMAYISLCDSDGNEVLHSNSLVDMVNSECSFQVFDLMFGSGTLYSAINPNTLNWILEPNNVRNSDYYDIVWSGYEIAGNEIGGIEIRYGGAYRISFNCEVYSSVGNPNSFERQIAIYRNGAIVQIPQTPTKTYYLANRSGEMYMNISETLNVELRENDILLLWLEQNNASGDLGTIDGFTFNIQKVR